MGVQLPKYRFEFKIGRILMLGRHTVELSPLAFVIGGSVPGSPNFAGDQPDSTLNPTVREVGVTGPKLNVASVSPVPTTKNTNSK